MRIQRLIPTVLAGCLALLVFSAAPALAATPETPVTLKATAVTGTTAVLHGELNPHAKGEPGEYQFKYRVSAGACYPGAEGLPEPPAAALGEKEEAEEAEATNLEPGTTYSFCLVADPESAFVVGPSLLFTTLPHAAPVIIKETTTSQEVGPFSATLAAKINPEKEATEYSFDYSTEESGGKLTGSIETIKDVEALPPEFGEREVRLNTGAVLEPEQVYYFHVTAKNATGTVEGPVEEFKTLEAKIPEVLSENVSALNSAEPKFEAQINPEYQETSYHFEYSKKEEGGILEAPITTVAGAPPLADLPGIFDELGILAGPVGDTDLQPGPTYFRVVATNGTGTAYGPVQEFRALAGPVVATNAVGASTRTTATVSGEVTAQGLPTTYHFAYVPQTQYEMGTANPYTRGKNTYETKLTEEGGVSFTDYAAHPVGLTLEELAPETTYDYALVASNELGTIIGVNQTFTTAAPTPPLATTGPAEAVSQLSAVITGAVDTRGLPTTEQFEFGPTPYGGALKPVTVVAGTGTVDSIAHAFTNDLQAGTTYYYRVLASNQDGEVDGAEQSFTTPGFPAALAPATVLPFVPYTSLAVIQAREAKEGKALAGGRGLNSKSLTRSEKLAKALRACGRERGKAKRAECRRRAHRKFAPAKGRKK